MLADLSHSTCSVSAMMGISRRVVVDGKVVPRGLCPYEERQLSDRLPHRGYPAAP